MKKTIAIIGVDGTGKSTLICQLQKRLGAKAIIKYMGSVRFEDKRISKIKEKKALSYLDIIKIQLLTYRCFWNRYKDAVNDNKLVLFDRYVDERFINSIGIYKVIATILYKYLFPRPTHIIYLYCSAETSFKRKNDIPDKSVFIAMKNRFDHYYQNKKDCFVLNSDLYNEEELTDLSYNHILNLYNGKI